jgi:hypothetical protein
MYQITLDVATWGGQSAQEAAEDLARWLPVEVDVLRQVGPAGGCPEVRYTGAYDALFEMVRRYCSGNLPEVVELMADRAIDLNLRTAQRA